MSSFEFALFRQNHGFENFNLASLFLFPSTEVTNLRVPGLTGKQLTSAFRRTGETF